MAEHTAESVQEEIFGLIQRLNTLLEGPEAGVVTSAMLVWEEMVFDDNGKMLNEIHYAIPRDNSLAMALGLSTGLNLMIKADFLEGYGEDDETD